MTVLYCTVLCFIVLFGDSPQRGERGTARSPRSASTPPSSAVMYQFGGFSEEGSFQHKETCNVQYTTVLYRKAIKYRIAQHQKALETHNSNCFSSHCFQ